MLSRVRNIQTFIKYSELEPSPFEMLVGVKLLRGSDPIASPSGEQLLQAVLG